MGEGMATETTQVSLETSELTSSGPGVGKAKKCWRSRHERSTRLPGLEEEQELELC